MEEWMNGPTCPGGYTEGVRELEPRVGFETLGIEWRDCFVATLKELRPLLRWRVATQPFRVASSY
jgi:hypothetical protein